MHNWVQRLIQHWILYHGYVMGDSCDHITVILRFYPLSKTFLSSRYLLVAYPMRWIRYLNKVHRHKPHKIPVSGELPEVLGDCDSFFWMGVRYLANTQSGREQRKKREEEWDKERKQQHSLKTEFKENPHSLSVCASSCFTSTSFWKRCLSNRDTNKKPRTEKAAMVTQKRRKE